MQDAEQRCRLSASTINAWPSRSRRTRGRVRLMSGPEREPTHAPIAGGHHEHNADVLLRQNRDGHAQPKQLPAPLEPESVRAAVR